MDTYLSGNAIALLVFGLLIPAACTKKTGNSPALKTIGGVEKIDGGLDSILSSGVKPEIVAEGFFWSEGPVWVDSLQSVVFSDVPANVTYRWSEQDGLTEYLKPSGFTGENDGKKHEGSNGLLLNSAGKLVVCQHGDRRIAVMDATLKSPLPVFQTMADRFGGQRFNSPNDAAFGPGGALYFTDPNYGLDGGENSPDKELSFQGIFKLDVAGFLSVIDSSLKNPNGIAVTSDGKTLIVANSDPDSAVWKKYRLDGNGIPDAGSIFFDATAFVKRGDPGLPDGLKINRKGIIFATGPGGVLIFSPEGSHLGTIKTEVEAANCALNHDETVLYITASQYLLRIKLKG